MAPLIEPGDHELPGPFAGFRVAVPMAQHGLVSTVYHGQIPLATCAVAGSDAAADEVWPAVDAMYLRLTDKVPLSQAGFEGPHKPEALPWLAVVIVGPPSEFMACDWLGDFERCVA